MKLLTEITYCFGFCFFYHNNSLTWKRFSDFLSHGMSGDQFKIKLAANLSANEQTRQIWQCIHLDIMFHTFGHLSWCQFWGKSFLKVMHYSIPFLPNKSNFALHYITSAVHFLIWACLFTFNIIFNNVAYFWSHPHHTPFSRTLGCVWYSPGSAERETSVCEIKWAES